MSILSPDGHWTPEAGVLCFEAKVSDTLKDLVQKLIQGGCSFLEAQEIITSELFLVGCEYRMDKKNK